MILDLIAVCLATGVGAFCGMLMGYMHGYADGHKGEKPKFRRWLG